MRMRQLQTSPEQGFLGLQIPERATFDRPEEPAIVYYGSIADAQKAGSLSSDFMNAHCV
jgi:hypothetical protein